MSDVLAAGTVFVTAGAGVVVGAVAGVENSHVATTAGPDTMTVDFQFIRKSAPS
jgi:hypothetical protein